MPPLQQPHRYFLHAAKTRSERPLRLWQAKIQEKPLLHGMSEGENQEKPAHTNPERQQLPERQVLHMPRTTRKMRRTPNNKKKKNILQKRKITQ
jgi:hypothetical protein